MWAYRINVIVPAVARDALNALWTAIAPGGENEAETFGVPLSADGNAPATHYGISTAADEEMHALITVALAEELASTGTVVSVQDADSIDWMLMLSNLGLTIITEEPE